MKANYIELKKANCKNCYKCIRHCPVKSIRFSGHQAHIVEDGCILCGECFVACPQNAKEIRCDIEFVKNMILDTPPVYASIAPSFIANYSNATIKSIEGALMKLGFSGVYETAVGATAVKDVYEQIIDEGKQDIIISSCCPSINILIQKYYPEALKYLAAVQSPMQVHCSSLKKGNEGSKTVFIGPCISKKAEGESYPGIVDCVLTFEELSQWFKEENISLEFIPDSNEESKARLFPCAGGILKTMSLRNKDYSYISVDGTNNCMNALKDIIEGSLKKCFIEMSACVGSCINGPAMSKDHKTPVRDYIAVNRYAGEKDFNIEKVNKDDIRKHISPIYIKREIPGHSKVNEILHMINKDKAEQELNCGSCGYNTCREKAVAVYQGKADLTMCLPFLKEKAETFSYNIINNSPNGILVLNESLEVQEINKAALRIMNIRKAQDVLGEHVVRVLEPEIFSNVMKSGKNIKDKLVYLAEYQRYVEQTIIYDKSYRVLICIMRDVTEEEQRRSNKEDVSRKAIEITDKVIEKQMRVVQEIASLLGETTAETKIALTKLKETLKNE